MDFLMSRDAAVMLVWLVGHAYSLKRILEWLGIHANAMRMFQLRNAQAPLAQADDLTRAINAW